MNVFESVHSSWLPLLEPALKQLDPDYWRSLQQDQSWLPGINAIFSAFSLPLAETHTILLGESPYPRPQSANGYAFWDAAVDSLWSETGLSKPVNRATSLRNFLKMLLICTGDLNPDDVSQPAIQTVNKNNYVQTNNQLFQNLLNHGFLLLNASLVLSERRVTQEARYWQPFMAELLEQLRQQRPDIQLLLFGNIAKSINKMPAAATFSQLISEHPYNISFIHNPEIQAFFKPLNLLHQSEPHHV